MGFSDPQHTSAQQSQVSNSRRQATDDDGN